MEHVGWSGSLLLQTEDAPIGDSGREQINHRYVLYMTPLQKTRSIPLTTILFSLRIMNINDFNCKCGKFEFHVDKVQTLDY